MKKEQGIWKNLILITQFSISLVVPMLACLFVSLWIRAQWDTGYWVVIVGIVLGAATMVNTIYRFYRKHSKKAEKEEQAASGFNVHR